MVSRITHTDCLFFGGYKPCKAHKKSGAVCENCAEYRPITYRVLIVKLGAAGEVIRNTPLLHKIKALRPDAEITWLTDFPEFIPASFVQRVLKYDWKNVQILLAEQFDLLLSLDKEHHACALANRVNAQEKKGFLLSPLGKIVPAGKEAEEKWFTGVFDDLMKKSTKQYVQETFEICGWQWSGEKYILEDIVIPRLSFERNKRMLIGLNTGAGNIWPTRIWPEGKWLTLISALKGKGYQTLLLGGPDEHEKNLRLVAKTGAYYEGLKPFKEFSGLISHCDLVVTAVTMALHIAIALEKRIVLLNNIFNKNEFYLFGLGSIVEPEVPCKACYKRAFDASCPVSDCMELISPDQVLAETEKLIAC